MYKKVKILALVFLFGLVLLLNLDKIRGYTSDVKMPNLDSGSASKNSIIIPVALNSNNISSVIMTYYFEAPVKEFIKDGSGYNLVLDTSNKDIPKFKVSEKARILELEESQDGSFPRPIKSELTNIKKGSIIQVGASYNLKINSWTVTGITILVK